MWAIHDSLVVAGLLAVVLGSPASGESLVLEPEQFAGLELYCVNQWSDFGWHDFRNVTLQVVKRDYIAQKGEYLDNAVQLSLRTDRISYELERDSLDNFRSAVGSKLSLNSAAPFADNRNRRLWTPHSLLGDRSNKYLWVECSAPSSHLAPRVQELHNWIEDNMNRQAVIRFDRAHPSTFDALYDSLLYKVTTWCIVVVLGCEIVLGLSFLVEYYRNIGARLRRENFRLPMFVLVLEAAGLAFIWWSIVATWNRTQASPIFTVPIMWALTLNLVGISLFTTALVWKYWGRALKSLDLAGPQIYGMIFYIAVSVPIILEFAIFHPQSLVLSQFFITIICPMILMLCTLISGIIFLLQARRILRALNFVVTNHPSIIKPCSENPSESDSLSLRSAKAQIKNTSQWALVLALANILNFLLASSFAFFPVTEVPVQYFVFSTAALLARVLQSVAKFHMCRLPLRFRATPRATTKIFPRVSLLRTITATVTTSSTSAPPAN